MRVLGLVLVGYFFMVSHSLAQSHPRLQVNFNNTVLHSGDTLVFDAVVENHKHKYSTLHLFVEDAAHTRQWTFRYPLEDGACSGWLAISDSVPPGVYAFNFMVQKELVHIMGQVKGKKPPEGINYLARGNGQDLLIGTVKVDEAGIFQLPNLMIDNKATFVFTPLKKTPDNWLDILLETPVDSNFYALAKHTAFITVGKPFTQYDTVAYAYNREQFIHPPATLQDVVVKGKAKTAAEKLVEKFQGGVFDGRGYLFDGMDDNAIAAAGTVFDFLMGRVPGLNIYHNRVDFSFEVLWRGFEPVYFVDGMETDKEGILAVAANEVAAIKVISPPFYWTSMGSAGGAIAIFTKRGNGGSKYGNKFRFVVNGYTPQVSLWY